MEDYLAMEKIVKAFASATRLEILYCIQAGVNNPGLIANKIDKHRSTVENHLRILQEANVIKKLTTQHAELNITVNYVLKRNANIILATIKHLLQEK